MKKSLIALAVLAAVGASLAVPALAQPGFGHGYGPNPAYMARVLDLTPEQQAKLRAIRDGGAGGADAGNGDDASLSLMTFKGDGTSPLPNDR